MKRFFIVLLGIMGIGLLGCGQQKYKLDLDGYGLTSKKTAYAEGAVVKVTYGLIATDTDYSFYLDCEDTNLTCDYDDGKYVIRFRMPAHDVKLTVNARNSMMFEPDVLITFENRIGTADVWITEDTPEKRRQSVWSGTTIKACAANEPCEIVLDEISGNDLYIIRMTDDHGLYYEAYGVEITDGQSVVIRENDHQGASVSVYDGAGNLVNEYEMFAAAL